MLKKIIIQNLLIYFVLINSLQSAESGGMPQLNPEFWFSQIFWLVVTFGILYLVLLSFIIWFIAYILFKKGYKIKS